MSSLRRLSFVALGVALAHLIFGAIVRISGSGMGCGDHWPKCHGYWFPPLERPDLIIEVSHRYLAALLIATLLSLLVAALRRRREPGVGGPGGVLRAAGTAATLVVVTALFGAVTVKLGNAWYATVVHWILAAGTLAALAAAAIRAGGLGGDRARAHAVSVKTARGAAAGAALALLVVVLGGLTAKIPGANFACVGFPLCRETLVGGAPLHVQLTHRILAFLLLFHIIGIVMVIRKRGETGVVRTAAYTLLALVGAQLLVAAAMVETGLPVVVRSVHQAFGVVIWLGIFVLAYLARIASAAALVAATEAGREAAAAHASARPLPGALPGGA